MIKLIVADEDAQQMLQVAKRLDDDQPLGAPWRWTKGGGLREMGRVGRLDLEVVGDLVGFGWTWLDLVAWIGLDLVG